MITCIGDMAPLASSAFNSVHNKNIILWNNCKTFIGCYSRPLFLRFYVYKAPCSCDYLSQHIPPSPTCCISFAPIIQLVLLQISYQCQITLSTEITDSLSLLYPNSFTQDALHCIHISSCGSSGIKDSSAGFNANNRSSRSVWEHFMSTVWERSPSGSRNACGPEVNVLLRKTIFRPWTKGYLL